MNAWIEKATISKVGEQPGMDPKTAMANEQIIAYAREELSKVTPAFLLRKEFSIPANIRLARLYIATLGFHELRINGALVDDHRLEPSIAHYSQRAYYVVKDLSTVLQKGNNCIGLTLSKGRYNETPNSFQMQFYGEQPATRVMLIVETTNGETMEMVSDETWKSSEGPVIVDSFWIGEVQDATREQPGWDCAGFNDRNWAAAALAKPVSQRPEWNQFPKELVALPCPPEREIKRIKPVSMKNPAPGVWVFDMGELVVGNAELKVRAPAGTKLSLRYSEDVRGTYPESYYRKANAYAPYCVDPETGKKPGMLAPKPRGVLLFFKPTIKGKNLPYAMPADLFLTGGKGKEVFQRKFGYRPFRYVELIGYPGEPTLETVTGVVIHTDLKAAGTFTSSNPLLNKIEAAGNRTLLYCLHGATHDNTGGEKGYYPYNASLNFGTFAFRNDFASTSHKVLEDVHVFTESECLAESCFSSRHAGRIVTPPSTISELQNHTELPWQHYLFYGDRRELEARYPLVQKYIKYWFQNPKYTGYLRHDKWSDHTGFSSSNDIPGLPKIAYTPFVPNEFYGSAIGHKVTGTAARIAGILNHQEGMNTYRQIQTSIADAVNAKFFDPAKTNYCPEALTVQGANALALYCGLATEKDGANLADNIVADMKEKWNGHLSTGSRASYPLLAVLSKYGRIDDAYAIMARTNYPSLGHMLSFGTGTIGESWEFPDAPPMASHCQNEGYTQMTRWFYQDLCGLNPDPQEPGFKHFFLQPQIPKDLKSAGMEFQSPYGRIATSWEQKDGSVTLKAQVPWNTSATVKLPGFTQITINGKAQDKSEFILPAGKWEIVANKNNKPK
jgi:alpha-L-rhamnosidase